MNDDLISVGEIIGTRGNKGEVKVKVYHHDPHRLEKISEVFLVSPFTETIRQATIQKVWYFKGFPVVSFKEYHSIAEVKKFRGFLLKVPEKLIIKLPADEYFWHDLIGSAVFDVRRRQYGTIVEIIETGSNEVLVARDHDQEFLIPFLKSVIKSVDIKQKEVIIKPLPGLFSTDED
ncbi:ribosome maturation factor RimM [candidate division CSSED10-310 bacterium]|uniref:Ribosome maturation factor RimM n=1 Tax=candidate division CSSED10-310 bacterium TaxID=2855610 RepID=A0ABV6YZJ8_UNCC1